MDITKLTNRELLILYGRVTGKQLVLLNEIRHRKLLFLDSLLKN